MSSFDIGPSGDLAIFTNNSNDDMFNYITHLASSLGIYKPEDFRSNPKTYCGTVINSSPCSENTCSYKTIKL